MTEKVFNLVTGAIWFCVLAVSAVIGVALMALLGLLLFAVVAAFVAAL